MFTGRDGLIGRMRSQMVGAVDFITKPIELEVLIDKVDR
jgi:FixJ family two-component response regulator